MESKLNTPHEQLDTSDRTAQRRDTILAVRATMKTMSSSISNTSGDSKSRSYMKKLSSNISSKSLLTAQEVGAEFLFRIIDVSDDDNTIDEKELFDALVTLGVMIPSDAFEYLFRDMDESKDGKLQLDEFCKYVSNIKPGLSKRRRRMTTLKYMV
jgi:Ca2+-binding EF-hand superfamily protein